MQRWQRWCAMGVVLAGLFGLCWQQELEAAKAAKVLQVTSRADVLAAIRVRSDVLINIHRRLFPATWDITLLGQRATPALRKGLLGNTRGRIRWKCAQILTQLRDPTARPTLHRALGDWSPAVRGQVLRALAELGDASSIKPILARLRDAQETSQNRALALRTLGRLGDVRAIGAIAKSYAQANTGAEQDKAAMVQIRQAATKALWALRQVAPKEKMLRLMRKALQDRDAQVVRQAAIALGALKDQVSVGALGKLLAHKSAMLRNIAAYVLGHIGDAAAIPALVKALASVRSGRMLNNITFALQKLQDPKLSQRLYGFLRHQQAFIRLNAAFAVGDMKIAHARAELEKALQDPNVIVRNQAIIALAKIGDKRSLPALRQVIQQDIGQRRWLASLAALFITGKPAYRAPLWKQMLQSTSTKARRDATYALASLGDVRAAPQLFSLLQSSRESRAWKLAKRMQSPLFRQMLFHRTQQNIRWGRLYKLPQLLDLLGATQAPKLTHKLLGMVSKRWARPMHKRRRTPSQQARRRQKKKQSVRWSHGGAQSTLVAVLRYLGQSKEPQVRPWLQGFLNHRSYHVRTEARLAQALLGDNQALFHLVRQLVNASDRHRPYLVERLALLPTKRLASAVAAYQQHPDPFLQAAFSAALWRTGDVSALPQLLKALQRPQYALRHRAYRYLTRHMTPALRKALQKGLGKKGDADVQRRLRRVLHRTQTRNPVFSHFYVNRVLLD